MARKKSDTVDYFYHPVKNGTRMYIMEQNFGDKGYVAYYKLLELLGAADGHYLDFNKDKHRLFFAAAIRADIMLSDKIIGMLAEVESIDKELWRDFNIVWCQEFVDKLSDVYSKRGRRIPLKPNFRPGNDGVAVLIGEINIERKGKERKAEERKEKETDLTILEGSDFLISDLVNPKNGIVFYDEASLILELEKSQWLEDLARHFKTPLLTTQLNLIGWVNEQKLKENLGRALGEIKKHFFNTIKKQHESNKGNNKPNGIEFKEGGPGKL